MDKRRPGPDVTPEQLRDRSWWTGPECFVLVDDYDLVATGGTNPIIPLLEYLSQARDVGLHLVLTRRAGGAGRALYEPVLQRLRELGSPGLVMSGDRDEGPLVGNVRPGPQPTGRGWLVTRRDGTRLVQLAYLDPVEQPIKAASARPARSRHRDRGEPRGWTWQSTMRRELQARGERRALGGRVAASSPSGRAPELVHRRSDGCVAAAASATGRASLAVSAKPVSGSSRAAAKMTPSSSPAVSMSGPPELPLRTVARIV